MMKSVAWLLAGSLFLVLAGCGSPDVSVEARRGARAKVAQFQVGKDQPLVYFGEFDENRAKQVRDYFQLVVIEPTKAEAKWVRYIQAGPDATAGTADDVIVLGYFSAGEDARTNNSNRQPLAKGDGTGPRIDPRPGAPFPNGNPDLHVPTMLGLPSPGGKGYASYYLDDIDRNGVPDRNRSFGGAFVNAGDPNWFKDALNFEIGRDHIAGLREIMTAEVGRGFACDGVMLDTFDTPVPNGWTDERSVNPCEFEWTASGFRAFVERLRGAFPDKVVLMNRGAMFFNPDLGHYQFNPRGLIDLFLFESFYSDSDPTHATTPYWKDNRGVYAPRLNAEADRPDGFRIVAIGYKEKTMAKEIAAESKLGWFSELSDPGLVTISPLMPTYQFPKREAPTWDSTFFSYVTATASPRIGLQEVVTKPGEATLRWDVANAEVRPVRYNLYYQAGNKVDPRTASKVPHLPIQVGKGYEKGTGPNSYPYEFTLRDLKPGTYSFVIRAEDSGNPPLEDCNLKRLTVAVP